MIHDAPRQGAICCVRRELVNLASHQKTGKARIIVASVIGNYLRPNAIDRGGRGAGPWRGLGGGRGLELGHDSSENAESKENDGQKADHCGITP